jgi:hypothetical protein
MTKLLEQAIARLMQLPETQQDAYRSLKISLPNLQQRHYLRISQLPISLRSKGYRRYI